MWFGFDKKEILIDDKRPRLLFTLNGGKGIKEKRKRNSNNNHNNNNNNNNNNNDNLDLFCIIRCEEVEYKTEVISSSSPQWNQTFSFEMNEFSAMKTMIKVTCYSSGLLRNLIIGELFVPLIEHYEVSFDLATAHWFPLSSGNYQGEISIKLGYTGGNYQKTNDNNNFDDTFYECNFDATPEILNKAKEAMISGNESTKRSERIMEQTIEISTHTLNQLRHQDQQIDKMEDNMYEIHENMRKSGRKMRGIESWTGALLNKITPNKAASKTDFKNQKNREKDLEKFEKFQQNQWEDRNEFDQIDLSKPSMLQSNFPIEKGSDLEEIQKIDQDTDRRIKSIGNSVSTLHSISLQINQHLDRDLKRLPALGESISSASTRMDDITSRCRRLANS